MGAFFLLRPVDGADVEVRRATLLAELERQGFRRPLRVDAAVGEIHLYPRLATGARDAWVESADRFCLAAGTLIYRRQTGAAALRRFLAEVEWPHIPWDDLCGQFCLLVGAGGALHLLTDRLGLYKVYRNADASVVSSSFLAVAATAPRRTVDPQRAYEYVFQGTTFGTRTVLREVTLLDADALLRVDAGGVSELALPPLSHGWREAGAAALLDANLGALRRYFSTVAEIAAGGVSAALTGGYDSRLMLALLRECGVTPHLYVYGADTDDDVRIARRIAAGEGLPLAHTNRRAGPRLDRDAFVAAVDTTFHAFDGYPVDGIVDDGSDLATRRARCRGGALALNGIGGELYRRPDLPNRPHSVREVVWRFFCGFDPLDCTGAFHEDEYCTAIGRALQRALGTDDERLDRPLVSLVVPAFYYRFWVGRNCSVNNRFGRALQPFCDLPVVREAVRIPVAPRAYGALEAALIRAVDPRLAGYESRYGHDFMHPPPPAQVAHEWRNTVRPAVLFRYGFAPRQGARPWWLEAASIAALVDPKLPYLRRLFHLERRFSARRCNRIVTLEYLFERCGAVECGA
ncbi:MAG: hypothetical protein ACRERC_08270 [Candidatus Binatia bacterium]